jgi:lipopolysaccharide transport system permease protein
MNADGIGEAHRLEPAAQPATLASRLESGEDSPGPEGRPHAAGPHFVIEPSTGWPFPDLREFWRYRELLYFMVWRDVKARFKQTALGVTWVVLQPLLTMLVFTVFFGRLAGVPSEG